MKLTYWVMRTQDEYASKKYWVRAKTKKAALSMAKVMAGERWEHVYHAPVKVTVEYRDRFDLLFQCLDVGGARWEDA